jgi:ABC-type nitrate/sulfonate/bicarbonate transport system substrate-binding protein
MIKTLLGMIFSAVLVTAALAAVSTNTLAADRLRISYSAVNATQAFLWVAQERGFFAKHGLEGELLYINSGTMNIAALVGGSVQVAAAARCRSKRACAALNC